MHHYGFFVHWAHWNGTIRFLRTFMGDGERKWKNSFLVLATKCMFNCTLSCICPYSPWIIFISLILFCGRIFWHDSVLLQRRFTIFTGELTELHVHTCCRLFVISIMLFYYFIADAFLSFFPSLSDTDANKNYKLLSGEIIEQ